MDFKSDVTFMDQVEQDDEGNRAYFVVSISKLKILYLATLGFYSYYWFYQHWKRQKPFVEGNINPILRSLFSLFFTHSLAKRIQNSMLNAAPSSARNLSLFATLFVVTSLTAAIIGRLADEPNAPNYMYLIWLAVLYISVFPLVEIQEKVNILVDDPLGSANSNYSLINVVFIVLGGILWLLLVVGLLLSL